MARRKTAYLSEGSDSEASDGEASNGGYNSQEDADSRAERALFEYNGSKRRKMGARGGKESAWEGIFGEDEDEARTQAQGLGARRGRGRSSRPRSDLASAPSFVTSNAIDVNKQSYVPHFRKTASAASTDEASETESDDTGAAPRSPRIRDEEDDQTETSHSGLGGLGFKRAAGTESKPSEPLDQPVDASSRRATGGRPGIGAREGLGARPGIGGHRQISSASAEQEAEGQSLTGIRETSPDSSGPPSADATPEPDRARSAFQGRQPAPTSARPTALSAHEAAHFRNIQGTYGAQLLSKFGWNAGEGLGKDRSGRAVPVEVGKVLRGKGITSGIRTEDSKREARRRGEIVSDSEEEQPVKKGGNRKPAKDRKEPDQSWRKQKKVKVKVEHKTYEQLVAEAGDTSGSGVGLVIDARGGELREVESLAALDLSGWIPTGDNAQLPELRHNLRLVLDVTKADVEALAREGRSVNEKRRWAIRDEQVARSKMEEGSKRAARLEQVQIHISNITTLVASQAAQPDPSLGPLAPSFEALLGEYKDEYLAMDLDEVVVGALAQVLRPTFADWEPFDLSSDALLSSLKVWRHAYRLPGKDERLDLNQGRGMTAWESLLWALWLPKVRSSINNDWSATSPQAAVHLLESWEPILPAFIRDNVLDQLVIPKVKQAMEEWDGRPSRSGKSRKLSSIVFPWLPLLGHRMEDVLDGAKRRIRHVMRKWVVRDGVPEELARWKKDIFSSKEWDDVMLRNVVPKLGICLRDDFTINPRKQDLVPLEDWVLPWHTLLRPSTYSQLLEVNFFPKWLDILYIWLIQPSFKADEVASWFTWWKSRFPLAVQDMSGVSHGFNSGLSLMQDAMRLGADAPTKLRKPVYEPLKSSSLKSKTSKVTTIPKADPTTTDITFRSLAEDVAAQNDLVFFPVGRSHDQTGKPLFKVSRSADGRGGVTVYVGTDAVFAQTEDGSFKAVSLDDMVKRALV